MPDKTAKSNLNNDSDETTAKGAPELPGHPIEAENKSSSMPPKNQPAAVESEPEDIKTDEAVDDIIRHESDELLAVDDEKLTSTTKKKPWYRRVFKKKKVYIPLIILLILIALAAVPQTRYPIFGLFWKQNYKIVLIDSQTHNPVTDATINLAGKTTLTDNHGQADLKVPVGHRTVTISKKYYKTMTEKILVPLHVRSATSYSLQATGRQVSVTILNKITGSPLDNVLVKAADTEARTSKNGKATIVLPADKPTASGTISASGYNTASITVQVTTKSVPANTLDLTPSGRVYFLSNAPGSIDVVSTNLDGTDRQTVLAGTGSEDPSNTALLATRDWKYMALLSRRSGSLASLYLINASNNKMSVIDSGNASFTPIGWSGHYLVYEVNRNGIQSWQPNATVIKSYNADTGKIIALVSSNASGTSDADAQYQNIWNTALLGNNLIYTATWYKYPGYINVSGQQNVIAAINPDGTGGKTLKTVDAATSYFSDLKLAEPDELYFGMYGISNSSSTVYQLDDNGNITQSNSTTDVLNQIYPTYLGSPAGDQTFWSELRDGKNTLFIGDQNGAGQKQIANLSDYTPYGWYSDNYLLVTKNGSELYVTSPDSLQKSRPPLQITNYYKPTHSYNDSGYGYGGL